jgi:hypothetical protein
MEEPEEEAKKGRRDRSEKLKERKNLSETVVKCCLRRFLRDKKNDFIKAINSRVAAYSQRAVIASQTVSLLIKEACYGVPNEELHNVVLPAVLEHSFIRQAMLGTEDAQKPFEAIQWLCSKYPQLKDKRALERHLADRNIYSAGSKKYLTNLRNHLTLNFPRVVKKILYSPAFERYLGKTNGATKAMLYDLNGWKGEYDKDFYPKLPKEVQQVFNILKKILGDDPIDKSWLKKDNNLYKILRLYVFANRFFESQDMKLFNLIPMCTIKSHYITIDTHSLFGIAVDVGIIDKTKTNGEKFTSLGMEQWASMFNTDLLKGKGRTFTGTIETDGVAVCVHYTKKKEEKKATDTKELVKASDVDVVGIDPGRTNIIYAVKMVGNQPKRFKLTRSQYYKESGTIKARRNTEEWLIGLRPSLELLSKNSSKGHSLEAGINHLQTILKVWDLLWTENLHAKWANQRLRLYGGKKRVFAKFLNKLETPRRRLVIAYGAAKFAPGGKNELSVPTSRVFKECSYRFPTFPVDEFRTSRVFNGDKTTILKKVVFKSNQRKEVRGLLWCDFPQRGRNQCSTNGYKGKLINRDLNAALNIRDCFLVSRRPPMLTRQEGGEKLIQEVGYLKRR